MVQSDDKIIEKAVSALKQGQLVAFPTETVYGLGANGLNENACKAIYKAKGRPSDNPLILHIANRKMLDHLVISIPSKAKQLMDAFWPGPLTLIFKKQDSVPSIVSGGLDTVAIRFPSNTIAQNLINACGFPLAAPSANKSGKPSPTNASHVREDFSDELSYIIDGGNSVIGLESTVIDVTVEPPIILRPGEVTKEMITEVIGEVRLHSGQAGDTTPRAPGMKYRHYSPKMPVYLVATTDILLLKETLEKENQTIGLIFSEEGLQQLSPKKANLIPLSLGEKNNLSSASHNLFSRLRQADRLNLDVVYIEAYEKIGLGVALMNRIEKMISGKFNE